VKTFGPKKYTCTGTEASVLMAWVESCELICLGLEWQDPASGTGLGMFSLLLGKGYTL